MPIFRPNYLFALTVLASAVHGLAPLHQAENVTLIEHEYAVVLHHTHSLEAHFQYIGKNLADSQDMFRPMNSINGYRARLDPDMLHDLVRSDPGVRYVQQDHYVDLTPTTENQDDHSFKTRLTRRWTKHAKSNMKWFLRMLTAAGSITPTPVKDGPGEYLDESGKGVHIYVIDTGIRITHTLFNGMAVNFKGATDSPYAGEPMTDTIGHGTAILITSDNYYSNPAGVAGVAAQNAPSATIVNVKVAGVGSTENSVANAINDVTDEHKSYRSNPGPDWRGSIINMSFRDLGATGPILTDAITNAIAAGIPVVSSAGNGNTNQVTLPCGIEGVICVAACDASYGKYVQSNYGPQITIVAPGVRIKTAWFEDDTTQKLWSGTSMASPAVAATMSIFISSENIIDNADKVAQRLTANQLNNVVTGFSQDTTQSLVNTGLNSPNKDSSLPYVDAPASSPPDAEIQDAPDADTSDAEDAGDIDGTSIQLEIDSNAWTTVPKTCSSSVPYADAMTLMLRVAMTAGLNICTPNAGAPSTCNTFDTEGVDGVNGENYALCGTPGNCVSGDPLQNAVKAIGLGCVQLVNGVNMTGGRVDMGAGFSVQL